MTVYTQKLTTCIPACSIVSGAVYIDTVPAVDFEEVIQLKTTMMIICEIQNSFKNCCKVSHRVNFSNSEVNK